jgi:hypothetical protein
MVSIHTFPTGQELQFIYPELTLTKDGVIVKGIVQYAEEHPTSTIRDIQITMIDREILDIFATEFSRKWPESQ